EQISNIRLDLGGVNGIFGFYTLNASERSVYSGITWGNHGTVSGAGFFFDNSESPQQSPLGVNLSGTTRPVLRDLTLMGGTNACIQSGAIPGCYAIVQEGAPINIAFGPATACSGSLPIAWVTSVNSSGQITGINVGSGGSGCGTSLTCTIVGAPTGYP
ncbi:MAG TPA: hypothetical protein VH593_00145, partial [Ktedonobacteraceae bacterium]